jgi:hypothetical protein
VGLPPSDRARKSCRNFRSPGIARGLSWSKRSESAPWVVECILLERALIEGKPALRIIARLARYAEDRQTDVAEIENFWSTASRKLGKLRRLSQRDRWQIETMLAQRIPKANFNIALQLKVRPGANPVTGPHSPIERVLRSR